MVDEVKAEQLEKLIRRHWDIKGLISDLREQKWVGTEPGRIDRMAWIAPYKLMEDLAKDSATPEEWEDVVNEGVEHEIVDEYMNALADIVAKEMKEHVYSTFEEGEAFLGQYEDMSPEEIRAMGFEIEG